MSEDYAFFGKRRTRKDKKKEKKKYPYKIGGRRRTQAKIKK